VAYPGEILVVDDEPSMCEFLEILLSREGHQVTITEKGAEALRLVAEKEFEVLPAITRALTLYEVDTSKKSRRVEKQPENPDNFDFDIIFREGLTELNEVYRYTVELSVLDTDNIDSFSVYMNNDYIGDNLSLIQINTNDRISISVVKEDDSKSSKIKTRARLL